MCNRSLQRALDRRLYLLLYGNAYGSPAGNPTWHFPEKVYESEETLRKVTVKFASSTYLPYTYLSFSHNGPSLQCAESALESILGDLSHTYFVGNAPMGHTVIQRTNNSEKVPSFTV